MSHESWVTKHLWWRGMIAEYLQSLAVPPSTEQIVKSPPVVNKTLDRRPNRTLTCFVSIVVAAAMLVTPQLSEVSVELLFRIFFVGAGVRSLSSLITISHWSFFVDSLTASSKMSVDCIVMISRLKLFISNTAEDGPQVRSITCQCPLILSRSPKQASSAFLLENSRSAVLHLDMKTLTFDFSTAHRKIAFEKHRVWHFQNTK